MSESNEDCRVLVVDDNVDAADSLALLIQTFTPYAVRVAYCGQEAVEVARHFRPKIAFIDLRMPQMSGYEAKKAIEDLVPHCKQFALSGLGGEDVKKTCMNAGFAAHLVKPVDPMELKALIEHHCDEDE